MDSLVELSMVWDVGCGVQIGLSVFKGNDAMWCKTFGYDEVNNSFKFSA